ncbi:hypothetical protein PQR02_15335 [Paraburkholderia sediminicola]|uniref:Uncharacterized protein n=1 Tax=Paraburkholderia rhynchosiae TaxID=487049 RepID=A0ACC7NKJ4_9BURK
MSNIFEQSPRSLKSELAPISTAQTEELAAPLAAVLDDRRKQTLDRLSQALSDAVPEFLQRAFEDELLASGKSMERRNSRVKHRLKAERPRVRFAVWPKEAQNES